MHKVVKRRPKPIELCILKLWDFNQILRFTTIQFSYSPKCLFEQSVLIYTYYNPEYTNLYRIEIMRIRYTIYFNNELILSFF